MSFGIRKTYGSRPNPNLNDGTPVHVPDNEEMKEIVAAIQKFKQKSAHSNVQNLAELRTVLGKSSVNPDINPIARDGVEIMLRGKHNTDQNSTIEEMVAGSGSLEASAGFSSHSVSRHGNKIQSQRLQKELEKELEEIRAKYKQRNDIEIENEFNTLETINEAQETANNENTDEKYQDLEEDQFDISGMNILASGFSSQMVKPGMAIKGLHPGQEAAPSPVVRIPASTTSKKFTRSDLSDARKLLLVGFPARAAMIRGSEPRTGSMSGMAVRKTALGLVDGF